jgi:hypothetical protein
MRLGAWWFVVALGMIAVLGLGSPALAADVTGTWKWTVERGGNTFEQTLKLKQEGEKVTGTITGRQGNETEIEDAKITGDTIAFKVTREFNGNKFVMNYSGKVTGDTIKGETKVERDGETQTREWEAKRSK